MNRCPICKTGEIETFLHLKNSPLLQNLLFGTEADAKATQQVDVQFMYCPVCHFVYNPEFQDSRIHYDEKYDNNQLASKVYIRYIDELTDKIIRDCKLDSQSRILEVGCGNGYFLSQLHKKLRNQNVIGYDPAYNDQHGMENYIRKCYFKPQGETFDLIILRHCLESLIALEGTLASIVAAMNDHTQLYVEVTNLNYIITHKDISLMCHEYARYYSVNAIQRLLDKFDLELETAYTLFNKNYMGVFARKRPYIESIGELLIKLEYIVSRYQKVVIWGIAGRAISFLSHNYWDKSKVQFGVDIDKCKQGKYIPVTGQRILSPEEAFAFEPDLVIVANKNYLDEIKTHFSSSVTFLTLDGRLYEQNS